MRQLIECVPNFSEGRDMSIIKQITNAIESVDEITLLDVDPGNATNRTVVTFVGEPIPVMEAAVRGIRKASELIDMSKHSGAHPRFGATDVCPLVPVANISMEETVKYARQLAERVGTEIGVPVFCYENAAFSEVRKNLANCRAGEYEALPNRITTEEWKPDFGPSEFTDTVAKSGVTAVGARDFLVAFNVNLNTTSTRRANAVAFDVRERGRKKREGSPVTGKLVKDEKGNQVWVPGALKEVKAIGWFIDEFGIAQISMNLTNISITPVHIAYDEVYKKANERGIRATGSELVGLIPLNAMLEAGKYFLRKQNRSLGVSDNELIKIAVKSMGLDDLYKFKPEEKIIEYSMAAKEKSAKLIDMNLSEFVWETASESPAPGGGSIAAYMGSLGAALGTMVANLSSHKRGWDERWETFSDWAEKGKYYHDQLLAMVDEDTNAFNKIMDAFGLSKKTDKEIAARQKAIMDATKYAIEVPLKTMKLCFESMDLMKAMVQEGNPNSVTDAAVGALAATAGIRAAYLNVRINVGDYDDKTFVDKVVKEGAEIEKAALEMEKEILKITNEKL
ncbi:MAG: glutamate formimidoyltransferase [Bacteroidales bacterium]|jgi:glutamate formiminotransferase/formiminotetrahydrofolate cyclodeaminase|nr:glutamate formimidoyltransferase [Bacteroidales bacterium]